MAIKAFGAGVYRLAEAAQLPVRASYCTDLPDFVNMLEGKLGQFSIMLLGDELFQGNEAKFSRFNTQPQTRLN